jgi:hypothetical protein
MRKNRLRGTALLTAALWFALASMAGGQADHSPILGPDRIAPVDDSIWPHVNWASFDQDKVVSYQGFQYSVYWDQDRVLVVVRRNLETDEVQTVRLENYLLADGRAESQQRNGHRNTVLGISPHDGRLHLSWDHHVNDLNYTRSRAGFLHEPTARLQAEDFEARQPVMPDAPQRVTYPRFLNDHQDTLYFVYRTGGSGSGDSVFLEYDSEAGTWSSISTKLFGLEGLYPEWENSTSRNAYMHDLLFDGNGRLHLTWVFRETSRTWASNHDLHYAYSDDRGRTWKNNAGEPIADTRQGQQITIDTPGIVVWEIPVFSWLMNQCSMALDSHHNPHVATFHTEEPRPVENVQHNPPPHISQELNFYHYWRDNGGQWHRSKPLPMPDRRGRPQIVSAPDDTIIIYFFTPDGLMAHVANPHDRWQEWRTIRLAPPEFTGIDITKPDRRRLREENVLSFSVDPTGDREGRGYALIDFDLERVVKFAREASTQVIP